MGNGFPFHLYLFVDSLVTGMEGAFTLLENLKSIEQRLTVHKMLLLMPDGGRYFADL